MLWFLSLLVYTSFEGSNLLVMAMQYCMGFIGKINMGRDDRPPLRSRQEQAAAVATAPGTLAYAHGAYAPGL